LEVDYSSAGFWTLMATTFILATTHSVSPDHWFPFVMVGRAKNWRISRVLLLAGIAGAGHTGTSVLIGLAGVFAKKGAARNIAECLENATPWLLMIFGFGYAAYALYRHRFGLHGHSHGFPMSNRLLRMAPDGIPYDDHGHSHHHEQGHHYDPARDLEHGYERNKGVQIGNVNLYLHNMDVHITISHDDHSHDFDKTEKPDHAHPHSHFEVIHSHEHHHEIKGKPAPLHSHDGRDRAHRVYIENKKAGLGLVAILGLTPCIALLPMTFATVKYGTAAIILVNGTFAVATIGTILFFTWLGCMGLSWIKLNFFDEYGDIIAGSIIALLGVTTKVFAL